MKYLICAKELRIYNNYEDKQKNRSAKENSGSGNFLYEMTHFVSLPSPRKSFWLVVEPSPRPSRSSAADAGGLGGATGLATAAVLSAGLGRDVVSAAAAAVPGLVGVGAWDVGRLLEWEGSTNFRMSFFCFSAYEMINF